MKPHVVRAGEYLTKLAVEHGFDAREVWQHPRNQELRERRPNREQLAPGDVIMIPQVPPPPKPLTPGATHQFTAIVPRVRVKVALHRGGRPMANERYVVDGVPGPEQQGQSDGQGMITIEVPVGLEEAVIVLPEKRIVMRTRIGHLQPPSQRHGVVQRLTQLGYLGYSASVRSDVPGRAVTIERALRRFQADQRLPVTGEINTETSNALAQRHGS